MVARAIQVFSNIVFAAIRVLVVNGVQNEEGPTSLKTIIEIFDELNVTPIA